jgi:hypothetical protein
MFIPDQIKSLDAVQLHTRFQYNGFSYTKLDEKLYYGNSPTNAYNLDFQQYEYINPETNVTPMIYTY